ncbi:MAG: Spy/CpxP family protein refolding chaperone [Sulfurifustis sp.]
MNAYRTVFVRGAAALAVTASLLAVSPTWSQTNTGNTTPSQDAASRQAHMQERVQARLDEFAKRLEITPAQQPAWDTYVKTVQNLIPANPQTPPADADAATLLRFRAQRASEHAQKLTQLADATSTLEQTLTPEQRKVLDDTVRHSGFMGGREGMRSHHGPMPHRGGQ